MATLRVCVWASHVASDSENILCKLFCYNILQWFIRGIFLIENILRPMIFSSYIHFVFILLPMILFSCSYLASLSPYSLLWLLWWYPSRALLHKHPSFSLPLSPSLLPNSFLPSLPPSLALLLLPPLSFSLSPSLPPLLLTHGFNL